MQKALILNELIEHLKMSVRGFEKAIKVSDTRIDKAIARNSKLNYDIVEMILRAFPQVNKNWLVNGEMPMIIDLNNKSESSENLPHPNMTNNKEDYQEKYIQLLEDKTKLLQQHNTQLEQIIESKITVIEGSLNSLLKSITMSSSQHDAALTVVGNHLDTLAQKVTGIYEFLNSSAQEETAPSQGKKASGRKARA